MRIRWLFVALALSALLFVLNFFAEQYDWYFYYRWFDTPMHILGGVVLASFFVGLSHTFRPWLLVAFLSSIFVGWEIFEYYTGISTHQSRYWLDTYHDLLNDALGATVVYVLARFTLWRSV